MSAVQPRRDRSTPRGPSPLPALTRYAARTCLPPRRRIAMLLPCVAAVVFGLLVRGVDHTAHDFGRVAALALFGLVLPVTSLIVGDAILGAEIRRGSFTFTWMTPVPTWQIVVSRWVAGTAISGSAMAVSFALAAVAADLPGSVAPIAVAAFFGAAAYVAVFMAIGSIAKRAAVWSLAFVFLVERLLGTALSGVAQLSPSWVARGAYLGLAKPVETINGVRVPPGVNLPPGVKLPPGAGVVRVTNTLHRIGVPEGGSALVRLVLIAAVGLAITVYRLPRLQMASSTD